MPHMLPPWYSITTRRSMSCSAMGPRTRSASGWSRSSGSPSGHLHTPALVIGASRRGVPRQPSSGHLLHRPLLRPLTLVSSRPKVGKRHPGTADFVLSAAYGPGQTRHGRWWTPRHTPVFRRYELASEAARELPRGRWCPTVTPSASTSSWLHRSDTAITFRPGYAKANRQVRRSWPNSSLLRSRIPPAPPPQVAQRGSRQDASSAGPGSRRSPGTSHRLQSSSWGRTRPQPGPSRRPASPRRRPGPSRLGRCSTGR